VSAAQDDLVGPVLEVLRAVADRVTAALPGIDDWGLSGRRSGQYVADLHLDDVVVPALLSEGFDVISEESGAHIAGSDVLVVVDPLDGSTNASRGIPWFATSLCAFVGDDSVVALVVDQAAAVRGLRRTWWAARGGGAFSDRYGAVRRLRPSTCADPGSAIVAISGFPPRSLGWMQFRALGAAALDLCLVADGSLDGFIDCSVDAHGVWDHAAGALICAEAGAMVGDALGRDLVPLDPVARRTPLAASTTELFASLSAARAAVFGDQSRTETG
jgi:myo-inositol-1(or 4)-monophosphatase